MSQATEVKTVNVVGRIVWTAGDLFKGQKKLDHNTRRPRLKQDGSEMMEYGFGLAIPKTDLNPGMPAYELWTAMQSAAQSLYPSGNIPPSFAWKWKDGDGIDHNGAKFSDRQGHAGNIIFAMKTSFPVKFFRWQPTANGTGMNIQVNEGIKCGDYVEVQVGVSSHPAVGQGKAGLYLNPYMVRLNISGPEIVNMPSPDTAFGSAAPVPMPGAIQDTGPTPMGMMGAPQMMPQGAPVGMPQQQQAQVPPAAPQMPATPHYGVIPQQLQPQGAPQMMPGMPQQPGFATGATGPSQMSPSTPMPTGGFAPSASPSNMPPWGGQR